MNHKRIMLHTGKSFIMSSGSGLLGSTKLGGRLSLRFTLTLIGGVGMSTESPSGAADSSVASTLISFLENT